MESFHSFVFSVRNVCGADKVHILHYRRNLKSFKSAILEKNWTMELSWCGGDTQSPGHRNLRRMITLIKAIPIAIQ
jgi:hypothetical protein